MSEKMFYVTVTGKKGTACADVRTNSAERAVGEVASRAGIAPPYEYTATLISGGSGVTAGHVTGHSGEIL